MKRNYAKICIRSLVKLRQNKFKIGGTVDKYVVKLQHSGGYSILTLAI